MLLVHGLDHILKLLLLFRSQKSKDLIRMRFTDFHFLLVLGLLIDGGIILERLHGFHLIFDDGLDLGLLVSGEIELFSKFLQTITMSLMFRGAGRGGSIFGTEDRRSRKGDQREK